jgi:hypothetical protein
MRSTNKQNYIYSYALMAFTRIIITSGISVIFFYTSSFNFEQNLIARYREFDFASKLKEKFPRLDTLKNLPWYNYKPDTLYIPDTLYKLDTLYNYKNAVYKDGAWIDSINLISFGTKDDQKNFSYSKKDYITGEMFNHFGYYTTYLPFDNDNFYLPFSADLSFHYNHFFSDVLHGKDSSKIFMQLKTPGRYLSVGSRSLKYRFPDLRSIKGWEFWLLLLAALTIFYFIILKIIKRMFSLDVPYIEPWSALDEKILQNIQLYKLVFVIGAPGSDKLTYVSNLLKQNFKDFIFNEESKSVCIANLEKIFDSDKEYENEWKELKDEVCKKQYRYIIVDNFEYKINDDAINRIKLNFIESMALKNDKKIIILSTVYPTQFPDSLYPQSSEQIKSGQDFIKWNMLLGDSPIIILPLKKSDTRQDTSINENIIKETQYTDFLQNLQLPLIQTTEGTSTLKRELNADILSIKLQGTAHNFYTSIWYSLTKEEKFILYDLAEDYLVNAHNIITLNMLIKKGLIICKEGTLRLFNKSFKNFILTSIGDMETSKIKKQIRDHSNWNKLRTPLLLIVLVIFAILIASQEEILSKILSYAGVLAAGIPILLKLFSVFEKKESKGTADESAPK